jgi:hypothetical protein
LPASHYVAVRSSAWIRIEGDADDDPVGASCKLDLCRAISERILDKFVWNDLGVRVSLKSKPKLPSFASMREENFPPSRKSTVAVVVRQSSDAAFHCLMSAGVV